MNYNNSIWLILVESWHGNYCVATTKNNFRVTLFLANGSLCLKTCGMI
jgi:hypothetical protein